MVNSNHELVVLSVKTESAELEYFVKFPLNYHKLVNKMEKGKVFTLPVTITASI